MPETRPWTARHPLVCAACACAAALSPLPALAASADPQTVAVALPTLAELEDAGTVIGEIRVVTHDIFDTDDPAEDKLPFRVANALHIRTRTSVVRDALLFKSGDRVSVRAFDETERALRSTRYLYDVKFTVLAVRDNIADIEVSTRDTWTLDPGGSFGRAGGANSTRVGIKEYNLLGTGTIVSLGRSRNVDRSGTQFTFSNGSVFGSRTAVNLSHAVNSDGRSNAVSVVRPFYALDSTWAAGAIASRDDRLDSVYAAGVLASQYRHDSRRAEAFGGWSAGLVDGWVRRWTAGVELRQDRYASEPGLAAPSSLPTDEKLVAPFVGYELIEDRFDREVNRNQIGRPEFFALGLKASVRLGWASTGLGSTRDALLYAASVSRGFEPASGQILLGSADIVGRYAESQVQRQRLGLQARWFVPHHGRWVFYASAAGDLLTRPAPTESLLLGGEEGLRGYPLRYQSGTRRALFTLEERYFTDLFVWRLFRLGGAAFVDVGRAWGGTDTNALNPGWLSDVGFGLRIANSRAAFGNVLHIDLAFPLNATPDIKRTQLLVKTKFSF
ncbi:BamA/TamA family outer membrane protein [uncultured Methylibium sp.]|uniref:BamA/TamA family outer membrane protein n=1 Tax=uncultured Methylibium sp. TaxID=381093 RepID=UPI0025D9FF26|nr:BamA/TamA family outer membrane protein [uncultured Methylibium sp.]